MKIHEYQAALLFKEYGINIAKNEVTNSSDNVAEIAGRFGGNVVVKAQVLVGGRGKAGGVKLAKSSAEAQKIADEILSMQIKSIDVDKIMIAEAVDIKKEYYMGITLDRTEKKIVFVASAAGGVEIEELAKNEPEKILKMHIDPLNGYDETELKDMMDKVFSDDGLSEKAADIMKKMYQLFVEKDCSLAEINPLVELTSGELLAIDAKINFDDNAVFKHSDIEELRNPEEYSADEIAARDAGLSFVSMDGSIGCIVNGAGLAMTTMDVIKLFGGEAANFLDVGGSSNPNKVLEALKIILSNPKVKVVLINIFGGITRCDDIAKGIIIAKEKLDIKVPLVIRLIGTNEKEGQRLLKQSGLNVFEDMAEAVKKAVDLI